MSGRNVAHDEWLIRVLLWDALNDLCDIDRLPDAVYFKVRDHLVAVSEICAPNKRSIPEQ